MLKKKGQLAVIGAGVPGTDQPTRRGLVAPIIFFWQYLESNQLVDDAFEKFLASAPMLDGVRPAHRVFFERGEILLACLDGRANTAEMSLTSQNPYRLRISTGWAIDQLSVQAAHLFVCGGV